MSGIHVTNIAVVVTFTISAILLLTVVWLKWTHRRHVAAHEKRRAAYLVTLCKHLAAPGSTAEFSLFEAEDDAFIDAVIDVRHMVTGPAVDTLEGILDKTGLIEYQAARLRTRFPLGKRLRAAVSLAEIGDTRAAPVLLENLNDREPEIRVQCARGLAHMGYTAAIDLILNRFSSETPWVRARFAETLMSFGKSAVWPLLAFVRVNHGHKDNLGVAEAIRILGTIGDTEVGPILAEMLYTTSDPEVLIAIIEALGEMGGPSTLGPLRQAFQSSDWRLRAKAATALGEIGDPAMRPVLATGLYDSSWWTRRNSAAALVVLPGGIDDLFDALASDDIFARDAAAEALADCGELIAAKERLEKGESRPRDIALIDHMQQPEMVYA